MLNMCSYQFYFPYPEFLVHSFIEVTQDIQLKRIFCTTSLFALNLFEANHEFTLWAETTAFTRWAITPSKVNRFG